MTIKDIENNSVEQFIAQCGIKQIIEMFDLLSDTLFWLKDAEGNFVHANKFFIDHLGFPSLANIIGFNDTHFFSPHIASQFIIDDQKVMQGLIVDNRLEMNILKSGEIAWFITSKRPIYNQQGQAIGSYGTSRHLEKTSLALSGMHALKTPVAYIRKNYMQNIELATLADISHLSISALERRFKKHLGKTPKQFINEVRLENARRLLIETNHAISFIANETGFNDHSYFSRQFCRLFGDKPSLFREHHYQKRNE